MTVLRWKSNRCFVVTWLLQHNGKVYAGGGLVACDSIERAREMAYTHAGELHSDAPRKRISVTAQHVDLAMIGRHVEVVEQ